MNRTYRYEDVWLKPKPAASYINSRTDVPIEGYRIIVAPMTAVVGIEFIRAIAELEADLRPAICIPRQIDYHKRISYIEECLNKSLTVYASVGIKEVFYGSPVMDMATNENISGILLDTANGYLAQVITAVRRLSTLTADPILAGNVNTPVGALALARAGATRIRIGIGTGAACSTRFAAGFYRGQITALQECQIVKGSSRARLIADGGIKTTGDINKAFGAGADYVMIGKLFAHAIESASDGLYWGLASEKEKPHGDFVEGIEMAIPKDQREPVSSIVQKLWDGIRSGISMSGYQCVTTFIGNGEFELCPI